MCRPQQRGRKHTPEGSSLTGVWVTAWAGGADSPKYRRRPPLAFHQSDRIRGRPRDPPPDSSRNRELIILGCAPIGFLGSASLPGLHRVSDPAVDVVTQTLSRGFSLVLGGGEQPLPHELPPSRPCPAGLKVKDLRPLLFRRPTNQLANRPHRAHDSKLAPL